MENTNCCICNKSQIAKLTFSCSHSFCCLCFHIVCLYNQKELTNSVDTTTDILFECYQCRKGTYKINKIKLLSFLYSQVDDYENEKVRCLEHDETVDNYCKNCDWKMCYKCKITHKSIKTFSNHSLVEFNEFTPKRHNCDTHKKDKLLICLACNTTICDICKVEYHNNHKIKISYEYYKTKLELKKSKLPYDNFNNMKNHLDEEVNKIIDILSTNTDNFLSLCQETVNEIYKLKDFYIRNKNILEEDLILNDKIIQLIYSRFFSDFDKITIYDYEKIDSVCKIPLNKIELEYNFNQKLTNVMTAFKTKITNRSTDEEIMFIHYGHKTCDKLKCSYEWKGHHDKVSFICQINEKTICTSAGRDIIIWNFKDKSEKVKLIENESNVTCMIRLNDGKLVCGFQDHSIVVYNSLSNYECIFIMNDHREQITGLIQMDNNILASCSKDNTIKLWDSDFTCVKTIWGYHNDKYKLGINCITQLYDGRLAAGNSYNRIQIWEPSNEDSVLLEGHTGKILSIVQLFNTDLISASTDGTIRVWNVENNECVTVKNVGVDLSTCWMNQLDSGTILILMNNKLLLSNMNVSNFYDILDYDDGEISCITSIQDNKILAGFGNGKIRLWNFK
jgi:WD40 repeat protein